MQLNDYLKKNSKKYLIFDFDETLFKLHFPWPIWDEKAHKILRDHDSDYYDKNQHRFNTTNLLIVKFLKKYNEKVRAKTIAWDLEFETNHLESVSINQHLVDFVRTNQDNYQIFIWSTNCFQTIKNVLDKHQLSDAFNSIVSKDKVMYYKPDPDGFQQIKNKLNENNDQKLDFKDFLMIGDSDADEGAAKAAGIDFFKVDYF